MNPSALTNIMNVTTLNRQTLPPIRTKGDERPLLTLSGISGVIRFNQAAVRAHKLKPTSTFCFHQNQDRPSDFFVEFNPEAGGYGFQQKGDRKSLSFGHRELARLLLKATGQSGTVEIPIAAKDPETGYCALITSGAVVSAKSKRVLERNSKKATT